MKVMLGGGGKVGLLRAGEGGEGGVGAGLDQVVGGECGDGLGGAAVGEDDLAAALAGVEEEGELQGLEGVAGRHDAVDDEAAEESR